MQLLNRVSELRQLDGIDKKDKAQLLAVFGRRRVGKTALLTAWLESRASDRSVYWVAHRSSSKVLLDSFSDALAPLLQAPEGGLRFSTWEAAFKQLATLAAERRIVVVIDELPYLVEAAPEVPSILQAVWDRLLSKSRLFLVLCGSHYHMMHKHILDEDGALYGRTTADMLLKEIPPQQLRLFLPRYSTEQLVEAYSVIGGVPKYLEMWSDAWPVMRNIKDVILSDVSIFRQEPQFLIHDEIAEPKTYTAILDSLGTGRKSPLQIANWIGQPVTHVGKYLTTLQMLNYTRRTVSLESKDLRKSRLVDYEIRDPYLRFHFTFVNPNLSLLEQGRTERLLEIIRARLDAHVAATGFEELCRALIARAGDAGDLPFEAEEVGRLWNRQTEFNVAAVNHRSRAVLLGECKWSSAKVDEQILDSLKERSERLRRVAGYQLHFALFSRSGFTASLTRMAAKENVLLYTLDQVMPEE